MTTEAKVTRVVLQQGETLQLGKRTYIIQPPCLATVMMISEELSKLEFTPPLITNDIKQINDYAYRSGLEMYIYARVIAITILGRRAFKPTLCDRFLGLFNYSTLDKLTDDVLAYIDAKQLKEIVSQMLTFNKIDFFYGAIISLPASNILKRTKSEEMIATASGHSSQEQEKD